MAKQLNVNLAFNADTSQAKKSIQELQQSLSKISSMKVGDNLQLKEASEAAKMLSYHLNQAYNATTGNIDLSALNHSLQKSSTNVTQLSNKLLQAGTTGQQAFVNLAQAISTAEYPMFRLGKRLTEFGNTLKNTVRWQFSSSMIHGMMGAYQQAIGYAEDLNESLTNIRVVTGNSVEEMARFAEYANKAAKSLGTTTTAYTDAALIFYQQGLGENQVKERTDITVKMANVTGQNVTTVSDQLTSIWNNFNKEGDVALEHYADVLTALGAATASSTDEIAGGLEKFAAIGNTIGLSYEYAAAALATITANTRESEDVVGTALKTIFARIQGLNLGETLEDGTDLNKYSEALNKVGIDIFDVSGEIKNMDKILDEMGERWQTLAKDEQIALAQAVAGVRQYNQLMALMDNWNAGDSDSMLANLETAYNADGALQKQADVWAESWEAARKRVQAAAEGVYDSILDDKMFIGFNNVFADMLTGLEQVIDGVGGLKGVFIGVGSFILSLMAHKIQPALNSFVLNIKSMFQSAQAQAATLTGELQAKVSTELAKTGNGAYDTSQKQQLQNAQNLAEARTRLTLVSKNLTEQEKILYQFDISLMEQDAQKAQAIADSITAIERERDSIYQNVDATREKINVNQIYEQELKSLIQTQQIWKEIMDDSYDGGSDQDQNESTDEYVAARQAIDEYITSKQTLNEIIEQTTQAIMDEYTGQQYAVDGFEQGAGVLQGFTSNLSALTKELGSTNRELTGNEVDKYKRQLDLFGNTLENLQGISADTKKELAQLFSKAKASKDTDALKNNIGKIIEKIQGLKFTSKELKDMGISLSPSQFKKFLQNLEDGKNKTKELTQIQDELTNKLNNFNPAHMISGLERLTSAASAMGSVAMMGQSISSMINTWNNTDLSFGEKLSTTFMSLSMLIPGTISAIKGLNTALQGTAAQQTIVSLAMKLTNKDAEIAAAKTVLLTTAKNADMSADQKRIVMTGAVSAALKAEGVSLDKNKRAYIARLVSQKLANGASKEEVATFLASKLGIDAETASKIANKIATDSLKTSIMGLLGPIGLIIAAITAVVAAFNAWNKAQEEAAKWDADQNQEQVDKIMERVDALRSEREELADLMRAYEEAKASSDGTVAAQQAIADATWDICEALGIEIDLLDRLQGKVDGYDSKIYAENAEKALEEIKNFQDDWDDIDKNFYTQYQDVVDTIKPDAYTNGGEYNTYASNSISKSYFDENGVAYTPNYGTSAGGWTDPQDEAFRTALGEYLSSSEFKYADKMDFSNDMLLEKYEGVMQFKGGVSAEEQYQIISEMVDYMSDKLNVDQQKNSEMFKWYEALVDAGENTAEDKDEATAEVEAQIKKYAENQTQVDANMSYDQVETYEQYLSIRDQFIKNLEKGYSEAGMEIDYTGFDNAQAYLEHIADEFLLAKDNLAEIEGITLLAERNPKLPEEDLRALKSQYKDVFKFDGSIDFDKIKSITELENLLKSLQAEADSEKIQAKVDIVKEASNNLSENMSLSDYAAFETESNIKWGQQDSDLGKKIIEYNEFLSMSYQQQVAYLDSLSQQYSEAQLKNINTTLEAQKALLEDYKTQYNALGSKTMNAEETARYVELQTLITGLENSIPQLASTADVIIDDTLAQAQSLIELQNLVNSLSGQGIGIDYGSYGEALINLASKYEICAEEIENYNLALASGNEQEVAKTEAVLRSSIVIGEAAEKYDLSAESLEAQTREIMKANDWSEEYSETAAILAVQNQRMNKGLTKLVNGWKDWKKILSSTNKTSQDYADTLVELSEAVGDLVGWYEDLSLSSEFVEKNMGLIEQASTGNVDAIIRLSAAVASYEVANAKLNTTIAEGLTDSGALNALMAYAQKMGEGTTAAQAFASAQAGVQAGFDLIANNLNALNSGASLTDILGGEEGMRQWVEQLNAYAAATGMTAEQMQTMLSSVGVTANVQTDYVEQDMTVPTYREQVTNINYRRMPYTFMSGDGTIRTGYTVVPEYTKATVPDKPLETKGYVGVASISMDGEGESPGVSPPTFTGRQAPSASAVSGGNNGGGGGGSTPSAPDKVEKREPAKKSDTVERYREVTDSIDNVTDALTRAERATARLWGKDKLDAMRQENKILAEQYKLLQQKAKEAEDYAKQDYNDLMDVADEIGVSVVVDTNTGDITNIEDVENLLHNRLEAAEAEYNRKVEAYNVAVDAAGDSPTEAKVKELETMKDALDAYEKDIIGGIEDDIEAWEDAEQLFQNSVETWEEAGLEAEEILDQMMQKNFDIWSESLQLEVEVNDKDLEVLDYYLSKIEDNVYEMAEAAALMVGNLNSGFEGGQLGEYLDNLSIYGEKYAELTDRLNSTDPEYQITSAQYKEGLDEIQSGLLDNLSSIQELDNAMMNYYGDTLTMVGEEIDKYTEKMEHQTSILEHYANMMDILGKSQDYEAMGTILEGQVKTIQNELDVAEAEYDLYASEAEKKRKLYEEAVANGDAAAAELYKGEWEAAEEAAMEAQSNMLDKTEQWAEAMKAVVENKLQGLAKSLEEALTGGTSFDQINTQLERAASLQEEYLTTTNQIYETNKLMRTAQQAMDKSTNSVAKQRLKDFIKETDQLQDKSKLSKYELEIQQAKYDLLLAEMALEDAQNAKTTVRLQRDSEGNMGYVYTADQSQLSQAQQQLEDAQNSLYNIGLEGANSYTEKYNQTMQEMYDTLTSISEAYYNGEIASQEEYEAQMLAAQEYYYEQLENFQDLYGVALQTDTRVIKDAWSTGMGAMKVETRTWKEAVSQYTGEATETLAGWYDKVDEIASKTGLDNIANKVNNVTTESQNLKNTILGVDGDKGVIGALKDELTAVGDLTGGYANLRTTIQGLITDYENLMKTVNNAQSQQQSDQDKADNGTGNDSGNDNSTTQNDGSGSGNGGQFADTNPGSPTGNETPTIANGQTVTVKTSATHFSRDGGNGTRMRSFVPGSTYTVMNFDDDEVMIGRNGVVTGWVKKTDLVGFDTGGYTGSWGSYGKMAMLHEKELVLNEGDTSNFLASMEVLERILEVIDLQSMNAQLGGLLNTPSFGNNGTSQTVEQNVHIEASFPGVSDRNEIEEAFNNLINTASQYANRKF